VLVLEQSRDEAVREGASAGDVSHRQREPIEVPARWQRQESERARNEESVEGNGVLTCDRRSVVENYDDCSKIPRVRRSIANMSRI
jgi:hypothetical protein